MNKLLILVVSMLLVASVAMADQIGIYTDATGSSCQLLSGFNESVTIIHKFSYGTTGARFKVILPPGSTFFSFPTPFLTTGVLTSDITVDYGSCIPGNIAIGNIYAVLQPGTVEIAAADGAEGYVISYTCTSVQRYTYTNNACVGGVGNCCAVFVATEPATWGRVKSLYR